MFKPISCMIILAAVIAVKCTNTSTQSSDTYDTYNASSRATAVTEEESLKSCHIFDLKEGKYEMLPNKTAYVPAFNKTYEEEHYVLIGKILRICAPHRIFNYEKWPSSLLDSTTVSYFTITGIAVSMAFMFMYLIIFIIVPDLHDLPGFNLASLCLSQFLSYLLIILWWALDSPPENRLACTVVGILVQFFSMGSISWMLIMSVDVLGSILKVPENSGDSKKGFKLKKCIYNSLICWGMASLFVILSSNSEVMNEPYKPMFDENCSLKSKLSIMPFISAPIFIFILLNYLLGITSYNVQSYHISRNEMEIRDRNKWARIMKYQIMYLRLAFIIDVTWVSGLLVYLWDAIWLWYLFAVLNIFQGLFIFIAFTFTTKVKKYFKSNLLNSRRACQQTPTTPTSQPYCFHFLFPFLRKIWMIFLKDQSNPVEPTIIHL